MALADATKQGYVKCWGSGSQGQLGYEDKRDRGDNINEMGLNLPVVDLGTNLTAKYVSISQGRTCAHLNTDALKCWGLVDIGVSDIPNTPPFGDGDNEMGDNLPVINLGTNIVMSQIILGGDYACVLFTNRKVKCFGSGGFGQLGYGDSDQRGNLPSNMGNNLPFVDFGSNVEVASLHISLTSEHSCIIIYLTQKMKCWGYNDMYQLGYETTNWIGDDPGEMGDNLPEVDLGAIDTVSQVVLGGYFTCALRTDAALYCWGYNDHGQLGLGLTNMFSATDILSTPVVYDSGKTISKMYGGLAYFCIVYDDLVTVKCIGNNSNGQLGQGDLNDRGTTPSNRYPNIPAIDFGTENLKINLMILSEISSCIQFENDKLKCFGSGANGFLGTGNTDNLGDGPGEMGTNLNFVELFPTQAPTQSPTTAIPTNDPTAKPFNAPVIVPTNNPTYNPTAVPPRNPSTPHPTSDPTFTPTSSPSLLPFHPPIWDPTRTPSQHPTTDKANATSTASDYLILSIGLGIGVPFSFVVLSSLFFAILWKRKRMLLEIEKIHQEITITKESIP